jgi:succinate-semialdehyde dehydrogenase/glutarate-semialdehyde dehydrogenase
MSEGLTITDPATGEVIEVVPTTSVAQCLEAVDAAAAAAPAWAAAAPRHRSDVLRATFELLTEEEDRLASLITAENGKVLGEAKAEVRYAADYFRWFSEEAVRVGGELRRAPDGGKRIAVVPRPVGVALLITPWNFPIAMAARKVAAAMAAGCTAVLKPAPDTPLSGLALVELVGRAGAPPGVVEAVLPEPPDEAVTAMLAHPAVRKLSFTGSTAVGVRLLAAAAARALRCSMELGGNAPFIVLDDADLDTAVEAAVAAKLRNGGASCVAANRFYVHESVAGAFVDGLTEATAARQVGPGADPASDVGPLVSTKERDKVAALVDAARDEGGRIRTGGVAPAGRGSFYAPTVIDRLEPTAAILGTEIFGPVAPVTTFATVDEVIGHANASEVGLAAYVVSGRLDRALALAEALDVGMVAVNSGALSDAAAPFGGVKLSGFGREGGREGIEDYLERTYVALPT